MPKYCSRCKLDQQDGRYHTKLPRLGYVCHQELFRLDENGTEQPVLPEEERLYAGTSYWKRVTDESAVDLAF